MKNRIIKFRAWDTKEKKWAEYHQFGSMTEKGKGFVIDGNGTHIISQYTGLKDKNGKEIYEEDIVKDKDGLLFVVGWGEDTAQFSTYPLDKDNDDHRERFNGEQSDDFEIIGNIYKNKNLIK